MSRKIRPFAEHAGLTLLLLAAFVLEGAKTPQTFFLWGLFVFIWMCAVVSIPDIRRITQTCVKEIVFGLCVLISMLFSTDFAQSLFPTGQALTFLLLWITLKTHPTITADLHTFYRGLALLGFMSACKTLFQMRPEGVGWSYAYGYIPVNPVLNATWLGSIGVLFVSRLAALYQAKAVRLWRDESIWQGVAGLFMVGAALGGPSRGVALAIVVALVYALWSYVTLRRVGILLAVVTLGLLILPSDTLAAKLRVIEGNYRSQIWAVALKAVADKPWTGYGLGNFETAYQRHAFPIETNLVRFSQTTEFAHNEILQAFSDLGAPAGLILLAGIGVVLFHRTRTVDSQAAKAAWLVMFTTAMTTPVWHLPLLLFLTLVWSAIILNESKHQPLKVVGAMPLWAHIGAGMMILGVILLLGWTAFWGLQPRERSVQRSPQNVYVREAFARALEATHEPARLPLALEHYRTAVHLAPNRAMNVLAVGRVLFLQNHIPEAMEAFRAARRIEPRYWEADLWIARCYAREGRRENAIQALRLLASRRQAILNYHEKVKLAIPIHLGTSPYEDVILGYDSEVVRKELAALKHS